MQLSTTVALLFLGFLLVSVITVSLHPPVKPVHIVLVQTNAPANHVTSTRFLSIALDSSIIADGFSRFDMRNRRLRKMMTNLSPGYLRIGGTMADRLIFVTNQTQSRKVSTDVQDGSDCAYEEMQCSLGSRSNFTLLDTEWLELYELSFNTGFTILFDLNVLIRKADGSWDYENAEKLIKFSNDNNMNVIWQLGNAETSDAYGGGAPGYSNRYIGTFIWLDKLGISAKMGLDVVVRQTLFKGFYALIDNNYDPTPNYWISVIYKAFVGPEVVPCIEASSEKVRLYCQCTNKNFRSSSVTLFGFNLKDSDVIIRVEGLKDPRHALDTIYAYVLSPYLTLFTKSMYLNKEQLVLGSDGTLPPFKPKLITDEVHVVIPAYSSAFFVIPTDIAACH
ncbi:heparanase [Holotrichia oblita]|uniref:Heparanase n=1 Tax=Holotrichia oblita TaxID=644536 RepID=A0ACB9T8L3_HOLOL|nr:heparanase [Holotrichia oblita]